MVNVVDLKLFYVTLEDQTVDLLMKVVTTSRHGFLSSKLKVSINLRGAVKIKIYLSEGSLVIFFIVFLYPSSDDM